MFSSLHNTTLAATRKPRALTAIMALVAVIAAPSLCRATPINYVIAPGTTVTLNGNKETITGSFTYDTGTFMQSAVDITLTGPSPQAGTYTSGSLSVANGDFVQASSPTSCCLILTFAQRLDVSPDLLAQVEWRASLFDFPVDSTDVTGSAVFAPAAVPEPGSLLLSTALTGLGMVLRTRRT
jgi:hypothetical protein